MTPSIDTDIALVGGGLQSGLIALAVAHQQPRARITIIESSELLGGNHTWCFHRGDLADSARAWVDPLVVHRWPAWDVRFPNLRRTFDTEYSAITATRLDEVVTRTLLRRPGCAVLTGVTAESIKEGQVRLSSGETVRAALVVDARGPVPLAGPCAYQKFLGLELELSEAAPFTNPMVMDASVEQHDGFRFVYALPFSPTRVLIEETYFSDGPELDEELLAARALSSASSMGLRVSSIVRTERGVLPLPLTWRPVDRAQRPLVAGYRGGFFHPTTGYSLPQAARVAEQIAAQPLSARPSASFRAMVAHHDQQARFAVLLNRLLFRATLPQKRRDVLGRFHELPLTTVLRFYALRLTRLDRTRILCGRPPRGVSFARALREAVNG